MNSVLGSEGNNPVKVAQVAKQNLFFFWSIVGVHETTTSQKVV